MARMIFSYTPMVYTHHILLVDHLNEEYSEKEEEKVRKIIVEKHEKDFERGGILVFVVG